MAQAARSRAAHKKSAGHLRYGPADFDQADWWAQTMGWRVEARGATFLWEASQGPYAWVTMADPEGNEFCIS